MTTLRIGAILRQKGWTQTRLADKLGISRGYLSMLVSGQRAPSYDILIAIAAALEVAPADLFEPDSPSRIPVLGRVGAGAKVLIDGQGETALYTLPCPAQLGPDRLAAVEVEGDSMAPAIAPGSVLFYRRDHAEGAASEYLGRVCIVETADGHVWAKQLRTGTQPGLFHLISVNPAADNLLDRPLRWASPVLLVLPPELVGN